MCSKGAYNTKREEDDNDDDGIHDKYEETQFKIVEYGDAEGSDLTNLDLQKEESSGKEVNKSEVEVSLVTKQPVDDENHEWIQNEVNEV
ncbi:hypothetical protein L6452_34734 [Arctium lappa]|uniref:Uncharacterized protein n=1 Tax=Arctium lappa TaxID=4217 RepID=A0ACB8YJ01_ARCLA|nr:hypothetical protein L6452_34734 [Arctium lappa]